MPARGLAIEPGEEPRDRRAVAAMSGARAFDFDCVLDRLHQRDRIGPARDLAARTRDRARKCIGGSRLVEADHTAGGPERGEIGFKRRRLAYLREFLEPI